MSLIDQKVEFTQNKTIQEQPGIPREHNSRTRRPEGGGIGACKRARLYGAPAAATQFKANILKSDDSEPTTGPYFNQDVYYTPAHDSITVANYLPLLADNSYVIVAKLQNGSWYLIWPTLTSVGPAC